MTDLSVDGRALPVQITRTYGSRREYNGRFGYGWDMNYNMKVRRLATSVGEPNIVVLLDGGGNRAYTCQDARRPEPVCESRRPQRLPVRDGRQSPDAHEEERHSNVDSTATAISPRSPTRTATASQLRVRPNGLMAVYGPLEFHLAMHPTVRRRGPGVQAGRHH